MSKLSERQLILLNSTFKKSVSSLIAKNITDKDNKNKHMLPVSGGNLIPIEMYKNFMDEFKDKQEYLWFIIYQRYFTNLYTIDNANTQEKSAFKNYLIGLFWFGCGAFTWHKDKLYSWGITPTKGDPNGDIEKAKVWKIGLSLTAMGIPKDNGKFWPNENIVYGKNGYNALPTIINLAHMIKNIDKLLRAFNTNITFSAKKIKYKVRNNDSSIIRQEMQIFNDVDTAIIGEIMPANDTDISNIMEELNFNTGDNLLEQIKSYIGLMQTYQGIYSNTNFKKERNITNEFKGDELMTEIQLLDMRQELEKVIENLNEKKGSDYILVCKLDELQEQESDIENDYIDDDDEKEVK